MVVTSDEPSKKPAEPMDGNPLPSHQWQTPRHLQQQQLQPQQLQPQQLRALLEQDWVFVCVVKHGLLVW